MRSIGAKRFAVVSGAVLLIGLGASTASAGAVLKVTWMKSVAAPGTPAQYNKVGVLKIGPRSAKNVLVLEPGTSAGSAYFVPLAQWLVSKVKGWQVWSIERRENLYEDQSVLTLAKEHKANAQQVFNYYLGWITNSSIKHHVNVTEYSDLQYPKQWGVAVGVQDMHTVIEAAKKLGGKVVLGGHSLGGAMVTAYATWDFGGHAGADDLAGLVFDDGAGSGTPVSASTATQQLQSLESPSTSPWLVFGFPAPYLGLYATTGALASVQEPNQPAIGQTFTALPSVLDPPERVTNLALFAYNTDVYTSQLEKISTGAFAFLAHLGKGISTTAAGGVHGWNSSGALTPPGRWATMLSGPGISGADGVEWYFPDRLFVDSLDSGAIDNGNPNAAQAPLGIKTTMGHHLPKRLLMYAFGAYGGSAITGATVQLAKQSHISLGNLTLVNRHGTYAHNDPAGAYPNNAFFDYLVRFLGKVVAQR